MVIIVDPSCALVYTPPSFHIHSQRIASVDPDHLDTRWAYVSATVLRMYLDIRDLRSVRSTRAVKHPRNIPALNP